MLLLVGRIYLQIRKKLLKWLCTNQQESVQAMQTKLIIGETLVDTVNLPKIVALRKWDQRFINVAKEVASWSKDPSTKVGAVLVSPCRKKVSWGYNGLPSSIADTDERLLNKELKNKLTVHAELNCILNATDTIGWTLYVTKPPCIKCAAAIIQANIEVVVCPELDPNSSWFLDQKEAQKILIESRTVIVVAK